VQSPKAADMSLQDPDAGGGTGLGTAHPDAGGGTGLGAAHPFAGGGTVHPDASGGAVHPDAGGGTAHQDAGGGAAHPDAGGGTGLGAAHPFAGGGTVHPDASGGAVHPDAGGGTAHPDAGGGAAHPDAGGGVAHPDAGGGTGLGAAHPDAGGGTGLGTAHPDAGGGPPPTCARRQSQRKQGRVSSSKADALEAELLRGIFRAADEHIEHNRPAVVSELLEFQAAQQMGRPPVELTEEAQQYLRLTLQAVEDLMSMRAVGSRYGHCTGLKPDMTLRQSCAAKEFRVRASDEYFWCIAVRCSRA